MKTEELFTIELSLSPRLIWMDRHGIWTQEISGKWIATAAIFEARGDTENDALAGIAELMGIELWNAL